MHEPHGVYRYDDEKDTHTIISKHKNAVDAMNHMKKMKITNQTGGIGELSKHHSSEGKIPKHFTEEVERLEELKKDTLKSYLLKKTNKPGIPSQKDVSGMANATVRLMGKKPTSEEVELEEENKPTNPELWSKAKSMAKSKFDVYPSAYANGWAAKWYKSKGGGWKSVSEETEKPESRKARIVRDLVKDKKNAQEEASDKFQKDPEISSEIQKN
jgi:hypothetical protein